MHYRHILLAADLAPDTDLVAERARALAANDARLILAHIIEPLALAYGAEMPVDLGALQEAITQQARLKLDALANRLAVAPQDVILGVGNIEKELLHIAAERGVDLIVIGSHSRKGLAALLGSTANAVLHHAGCDVLAVRIARH